MIDQVTLIAGKNGLLLYWQIAQYTCLQPVFVIRTLIGKQNLKDRAAELLFCIEPGKIHSADAVPQVAQIVVQNVKKDIVLARIIMIDIRLGNVAGLGDAIDRRPIKTFIREQLRRPIKDQATLFIIILSNWSSQLAFTFSVVDDPDGFAFGPSHISRVTYDNLG